MILRLKENRTTFFYVLTEPANFSLLLHFYHVFRWLICWVLWHINSCRIFNAKSSLHINISFLYTCMLPASCFHQRTFSNLRGSFLPGCGTRSYEEIYIYIYIYTFYRKQKIRILCLDIYSFCSFFLTNEMLQLWLEAV